MSLFSCFKKSRSSVSSTGVSEGIFRKRGPGFTTQPGAHSAQHAWAALYQKTKDTFCSGRYPPGVITKKNSGAGLFLVHTVRDLHLNSSPLLSGRAESIFSNWDMISTSLVDGDHPFSIRTHWANVGFILAVPAQNIIGTFEKDVSFPNHAGIDKQTNEVINSYALVDSYLNGINKQGKHPRYGRPQVNERGQSFYQEKNTYRRVVSPEELLRHQCTSLHNEVLVVGRSHIRTHETLPATQPVNVVGLYASFVGGRYKGKERDKEAAHRTIEQLLQLNPSLPVLWQNSDRDI